MTVLSPDMPGVLAIVLIHGRRRRVAECARCEQPKPIHGRGLCATCLTVVAKDGTITDYGYVKADRLTDYAQLRRGGLPIAEAAKRVGVCRRTGDRYERDLRVAAGGVR